jgi:hypothetical protein
MYVQCAQHYSKTEEVSAEFFRLHYGNLVDSDPKRTEYREYFLAVKAVCA